MLDDDVLAAAYHGEKGYAMGYTAGIDAAEGAVRSQSRSKENGTYSRDEDWDNAIDDALAAIRALKEKP